MAGHVDSSLTHITAWRNLPKIYGQALIFQAKCPFLGPTFFPFWAWSYQSVSQHYCTARKWQILSFEVDYDFDQAYSIQGQESWLGGGEIFFDRTHSLQSTHNKPLCVKLARFMDGWLNGSISDLWSTGVVYNVPLDSEGLIIIRVKD